MLHRPFCPHRPMPQQSPHNPPSKITPQNIQTNVVIIPRINRNLRASRPHHTFTRLTALTEYPPYPPKLVPPRYQSLSRDPSHGSKHPLLPNPNPKPRRSHPLRQSPRPGRNVIPKQRPLPSLIQLPLRSQ